MDYIVVLSHFTLSFAIIPLIFSFCLTKAQWTIVDIQVSFLFDRAIRRQKLYPKWNNFKFPELCYGLPQPQNDFEIHAELLPGSKCQGTPVCTGSVQARACVITHLDEIGILEKGLLLFV